MLQSLVNASYVSPFNALYDSLTTGLQVLQDTMYHVVFLSGGHGANAAATGQ